MANQLVQASGGSSVMLRYDPLGRFYETSGGSAAGITRFVCNGDELVADAAVHFGGRELLPNNRSISPAPIIYEPR
jgi:hypothetical protein